jgi:leucyl aminopeptidase (aminopeptidase T)
MKDPRFTKLANLLVSYSIKVKPGENVLVETYDMSHEMIECESFVLNSIAFNKIWHQI